MVTMMEKISNVILIIPQILGKGKVSPPEVDYYLCKMESIFVRPEKFKFMEKEEKS